MCIENLLLIAALWEFPCDENIIRPMTDLQTPQYLMQGLEVLHYFVRF